MAKRRNFYDTAQPETGLDLMRERNVESLLKPLTDRGRAVQRDLLIDRIRPNPFQARQTFNVSELVDAIKAQGFISRLRVRPDPMTPGYFQLVFGERRLRAAKEAGLREVPCDIAEHTDDEMIEIGLAENIQREDLDPLEEAQALQAFLDQRGYSIRSLADRIGKDKGYIENRLVLLRAPEDIQRMVAQRPDTLRAAREILKLPTASARQPLIDGVLSGTLNVAAVNDIVRSASDEAPERVASVVAAHVAAEDRHKTDQHGTHLKLTRRAIERDARKLNAIIERWRVGVGTLGPTERKQMLQQVEQHLQILEALTEQLE
jgi:ParB family transcriptional regulator, chromosome partitioning protein